MMALTKKYAPKDLNELVGNKKVFSQLKDMILDGTPVLLVGVPGIGKTSSVYAIAREHGYHVIETNASDERRRDELKSISRQVRMNSPFGEKLLFLLDEVDGIQAWGTIKEILRGVKHSLVMTANEDWAIPDDVKKLCIRLQLRRPDIRSVIKRVKDIVGKEIITGGGDEVDFSVVTNDMRSAINAVLYGADGYDVENDFNRVTEFFTKRELGDIKESFYPWLFDNAPTFLHGVDLYDFYVMLEVSTRSSMEVLRLCPRGRRGARAGYPIFLRLASRRRREKSG